MDNAAKKWYIIHIPDRRKIKSLKTLFGGYDITLWVPTHQVVEKVRNKMIQNTKPLFEGYVFANFDYDDVPVEEKIRSIGKLLKSGDDKPTPLSDEEIIKIRTQEFTIMNAEKPIIVDFKIGDPIAIVGGPFKHFVGQVVEITNSKVKVELSVFNRSSVMELPPEQVQLYVQKDEE